MITLIACQITASKAVASELDFRHDAHSVGLVDMSGKELVPRVYTLIWPLAKGGFEAQKPDAGDCTKRGKSSCYLDSVGKTIDKPTNPQLKQICLQSEEVCLVNGIACNAEGKVYFRLPAGIRAVEKHGPIFICYENPQLFLRDQLETIVCLDKAGHELFKGKNVVVISMPFGAEDIVAIKKPGLDGRGPTTIVGSSGVLFTIERNTDGVMQFDNSVFAVSEFDRKFCPALWAEKTTANKKMLQFANFLEEHNIIDMSRSDLEDALGPLNPGDRYLLSGCLDGSDWESLDFIFEKDKVKGWYANNSDLFHEKDHAVTDPDGLGIVSNVVFQRNFQGKLLSCPYRFVSKKRLAI